MPAISLQGGAEVQRFERLIDIVRDEVGDLQAECGLIQPRRHFAHPRDDRRQLGGVAFADRHEHLFDLLVQRVVDPPDHAEIDQADHVVAQQDDVSRVRIGVIKAVLEDHREVDVGPAMGHLVEIEVCRSWTRSESVMGTPSSNSIVSTRGLDSSG